MKSELLHILPKYFKGECSLEEMKDVGEWVKEDKANKKELEAYRKIWKETGNIFKDEVANLKDAWQRIETRMDINTPVSRLSITVIKWMKEAAVIVILMGMGFLFTNRLNQNRKEMITIAPSEKVMEYVLPDGTRVWLNKGSTLSYEKEMTGNRRKVNLDGEGYFDVAHDKKCPFIVQVADYKIKVLGTEFNIITNSEDKVEVALYEGSVEFFKDILFKTKVVLVPGEMAFVNGVGVIHKNGIEDINLLAWKTKIIEFENASIKDICEILSDYYNVSVSYIENKRFEGISFNASFENQGLEEVVEVIDITLDIKSKKENDKIIFY